MKRLVRGMLQKIGYAIVKWRPLPPSDLSAEDAAIVEKLQGYTMTTYERQMALVQSVRYLVRGGIEGCFVECGVWRGGSSMAVALALAQEGETARDLYLYDTFEGMTPPTEVDRSRGGTLAQSHLERDTERRGDVWAVAGIEDVRSNMASTGYPAEHVHLIKGPVEKTIPQHAPPGLIALLRLDTDWYASTKHELVHLFSRLREGGVLIIDDYGDWQGARKAVDEYFAGLEKKFYMHRIDNTGRLIVKL